MLTCMSWSKSWLAISSGLFFQCASRSMVSIIDSRRSLPSWGRSRSDILVATSPSVELDGASKIVVNLCLSSLEGIVDWTLLFLILTTVGWWGGSNGNAREEFCSPWEASLLSEVVGEGVIDEDRDGTGAIRGSTPLTLFTIGTVTDGFNWSFIFLSSIFVGLNLISNMYFRTMKT